MVGKHLNRFCSVFEFGIPYFELILDLSENTKSSGSNVENDVGRYGIYPDLFIPTYYVYWTHD